jgi:ABC-type branched-subunit amino acid transport system ATPase component
MSLLEVTDVSKSFGGLHALSACHIDVSEGAIHGLIGPNGSGKTTLFNVITGYERIQRGEVRFNGVAITNAPPDRVFGLGIGRTFQLTRIFGRLTVLENMLVATQRHEGWLRGLLRRAGSAAEKRRAMELLEFVGIARLADEPAGNLSFGQRKLLELASLLVADPAVLLLDEPAGGVNPTLIEHLADRIGELNKAGKTFLVVEHNMEFVMNLCHRVTVLSQGSPLVSGTPAEVRANPAVLDAYLGGEDDEAAQLEIAAGHPVTVSVAKPTPAGAIAPRVKLGGPEPLLRLDGIVAGYGGVTS